MVFKNLSRTIEEFDKIIRKEQSGSNDISREEYESLDYIDFLLAHAIIKDIGKTTSLQIANHILAHYTNDIEY